MKTGLNQYPSQDPDPKLNPNTHQEDGQALTEYVTLLVLIALVSVLAATSLGKVIREKIMTATSHINKDINFDNVISPPKGKRRGGPGGFGGFNNFDGDSLLGSEN